MPIMFTLLCTTLYDYGMAIWPCTYTSVARVCLCPSRSSALRARHHTAASRAAHGRP